MGTNGYYVYRWRGRYYVYYNHWDSYPNFLGQTLLSMIPKTPEAYKRWLEQKRHEYSEIERRFERVFTVLDPFTTVDEEHSASVDGLEMLPSLHEPSQDFSVDWLYILDLDYELFSVNSHSHFKLSSVPDYFEDLLEEAKEYSSGQLEVGEVHASIISKTLSHPEPCLQDVERYKLLDATLVRARPTLGNTRKPLSYMCRQLFSKLLTEYRELIWRAVNASFEEDVLYREVAFKLLCIAACSPELVRLGRRIKPGAYSQPFAMMSTNDASGQTPEFASELFEGYHISGKNFGSAPLTKTYWLHNVLISLERSLNRRENYEAAIYRTVQKGRAEGHEEFNAIVCSIQRVVLVRVTKYGVEHTKSLEVFDLDPTVDNQTDDESMDDESNEDKRTDDEPMDDESSGEGPNDWADANTAHTFDAIGTLFECTARRKLRPSTAYRHGVFPNELYRMIVGHLDAPTNMSCMSVSRAFRDFALDTYHMTDNIKVFLTQDERCLKLCHIATGFKSLPRFSTVNGDQRQSNSLWSPIIGYADGTGQYMPSIGIYLPAMKDHLEVLAVDESIYEVTEQIHRLGPHLLDELFNAEQEEYYSSSTREAPPTFDYSTFEKLLPTQEVLASSSDVVGLYTLTYFMKLSIFGYNDYTVFNKFYRSRPTTYIAKAPLDTSMQIGARRISGSIATPYAMIWAKQPSQDTSIGWNNAVDEAQYRAKHEFVEYTNKLWVYGETIPKEGVLVVLIGSKIKFFHMGCDFDLPSLEDPSHPTTKEDMFIDDVKLLAQISFQPLEVETNIMGKYGGADDAPLNVLSKQDRTKIESSFQYIAKLANSLSDPGTERRVN